MKPALLPTCYRLTALLALSGCSPVAKHPAPGAGDAARPAGDAGDAAGSADTGPAPVQVSCQRMDVLFVIDNSQSMQQEQANLAKNIPGFITALRTFRNGTADFRIGVTTTSAPSSGILDPAPDAAGALIKTQDMKHPWLESNDPKLEEHFAALAQVGATGSLREEPLNALRAALTDRVTDSRNAGFLRADAFLAMVIITDEDDTSTRPGSSEPVPVGEFVSTFDQVKGERSAWRAAVIAGGTAPRCTSTFGEAVFAARLEDFVSTAQGSGVFSSICAGDLSIGLKDSVSAFDQGCNLI